MICGAQWKVKMQVLLWKTLRMSNSYSRAWNQIPGLRAEAAHPAGLHCTQTKEVGLRLSQMLLLESDHLRWKRGERARYANTQERRFRAKGTAYTKAPWHAKDGTFQKLETFQSGQGREEGQGSRWRSQAWLFPASGVLCSSPLSSQARFSPLPHLLVSSVSPWASLTSQEAWSGRMKFYFLLWRQEGGERGTGNYLLWFTIWCSSRLRKSVRSR